MTSVGSALLAIGRTNIFMSGSVMFGIVLSKTRCRLKKAARRFPFSRKFFETFSNRNHNTKKKVEEEHVR